MNKIWLSIILFVLLSSLAFSETDDITDDPGVSFSTGTAESAYVWEAQNIQVYEIITLNSFNLTTPQGTDPTMCNVFANYSDTSTIGDIVCNGTVSARKCNVDPECILYPGTEYGLGFTHTDGWDFKYTPGATNACPTPGTPGDSANLSWVLNDWFSTSCLLVQAADYDLYSPISIVINEVNITNRTGKYYSENINENDKFYVTVNVTNGGIIDSGLQCNMTGAVNDHFDNYPKPSNFSLTNTNSFEFSFDDAPENVLSEVFRFRICRINIDQDLNMYINDNSTPYRTITAGTTIPSCAGGSYHEEINVSSLSPTSQVNVSIRCPTCGVGNSMRILPFDENVTFDWIRMHSSGFHDLSFNSTTNRYNYLNHLHSFSVGAIHGINVTCNGTTSEYLLGVGDVVPITRILTIQYGSTLAEFTDGISTESSSTNRVMTDCSADQIVYNQINLSWSNDTVIKSVENIEAINFTNIDLYEDGTYYIDAYCRDNEGNFSSLRKNFSQADTSNPSLDGYSPINGNTYYYSSIDTEVPIILSLEASDLNLYSATINVSYQGNGTHFFDQYISPINTSPYIYSKNLSFPIGANTYILDLRIADAHTLQDIGIYDTINDKITKEVIITDPIKEVTLNLKLTSSYKVDSIEITKLRDRYTWKYDFSSSLNEVTPKQYTFLAGTKENLTPLYNSGHNCHFVIGHPETHFLDFDLNGCNDAKYNLVLSNGLYYCDITTSCNILDFNSFGELNIITQQTTFSTELSIGSETKSGGNQNITCHYDPAPKLDMGTSELIQWACTITKTNQTENFYCYDTLYDAFNTSYLLQINPDYNIYRGKTTIVGGKDEATDFSKMFQEKGGNVIVHYNMNLFSEIMANSKLTGQVVCQGDLGNTATFTANFTPEDRNYQDKTFTLIGFLKDNATSVIVGFAMLLVIISIISFAIIMSGGFGRG